LGSVCASATSGKRVNFKSTGWHHLHNARALWAAAKQQTTSERKKNASLRSGFGPQDTPLCFAARPARAAVAHSIPVEPRPLRLNSVQCVHFVGLSSHLPGRFGRFCAVALEEPLERRSWSRHLGARLDYNIREEEEGKRRAQEATRARREKRDELVRLC